MGKQEEIREDAEVIVKNQLWTEGLRGQTLEVRAKLLVDQIFHHLDEGGVVIRVDGGLPSIFDVNDDIISALEYKKKLEGYATVESLIKEDVETGANPKLNSS